MRPPSSPATIETYCREALEILETAINLYRQGKYPFYRVAALQLRMLLCDATRRHGELIDISLLPQWQPDLLLPPLLPDGLPNLSIPRLALSDWLEQPLPAVSGSPLSIRIFIRRICEQDGGAHADPKPQAGLSGYPQREEWVVKLADIVLSSL